MSILNYEGRRVVVSGCFSGMGEATARELVRQGAEVIGIDYKRSTVEGLAAFHAVDLRDPAAIDEVATQLGGRIDGLFNCAGLPQTAAAMDVMKVNFISTRHLTDRVLPLMSAGSAIVSISSNGGLGWMRRLEAIKQLLQTQDFAAATAWCEANVQIVREGYSFSKEAIIVWTMQQSYSLIGRGIRINCTTPGPTQTPMMAEFEAATPSSILEAAMRPINRRSTPVEQAYPLLFLNSNAASYINGVSLPVDGGFLAGMTTGRIDMAAVVAAAMPGQNRQ
jgi:NAD(P)-dependent dehydrogenase (short-subunit alcohol dehydrogenase family)